MKTDRMPRESLTTWATRLLSYRTSASKTAELTGLTWTRCLQLKDQVEADRVDAQQTKVARKDTKVMSQKPKTPWEQAWGSNGGRGRPVDPNSRTQRAVQMVKIGHSIEDAANQVGLSIQGVRTAVEATKKRDRMRGWT